VGESEEEQDPMRLLGEIPLIAPCIGRRRLVKVLEGYHGRNVTRSPRHHRLI
jgi:hypothetical protein